MASNSLIGASLKNIAKRSFAQAAVNVQQQTYPLPEHQPQITKLPDGAVVASLENNSPLSQVSIILKSGSRYEMDENSGVTHVVRLCAGLKTKHFSAFGITRRMQQLGGTIMCETGREHMAYTVTCLRDRLHEAFEILANVAFHPLFRPWEVASVQTRLLAELDARPSPVRVAELLHQVAFRNSPLGHSVFIAPHRVGKITPEQLHAFMKSTHTAPRAAFVGLGVDHTDLFKLARDVVNAPAGPGIESASAAYGGGEARQEEGGAFAHVALVASGAKFASEEALALAVAQYALGSPAGIKYGGNPSSKLAAMVLGAGGVGTATPINIPYSDSGLFGVLIREEADKAGNVIRAIVKGIRALKLTESDIKVAKSKAKMAILMGLESGESQLNEMALQILLTGKLVSRDELIAAIDKVPAAAVQSALSSAVKGKLSMASIGALSRVPYLDQL